MVSCQLRIPQPFDWTTGERRHHAARKYRERHGVGARALGEEALFCVFKRKVVVLDILSNEPNSSEGRQIL